MQKLQMVTQEGENVSVAAVKGNFDDAQTGVKKIFSKIQLIDEMEKEIYAFHQLTPLTGADWCHKLSITSHHIWIW